MLEKEIKPNNGDTMGVNLYIIKQNEEQELLIEELKNKDDDLVTLKVKIKSKTFLSENEKETNINIISKE
jgi:hypothetical protein